MPGFSSTLISSPGNFSFGMLPLGLILTLPAGEFVDVFSPRLIVKWLRRDKLLRSGRGS